MGKRFAILIGVAALGAAVMAAGASADFTSVADPRGDTGCDHGPCSDSDKRDGDIVRATAGHEDGKLKHTIRVVGKFHFGSLEINTDSDRDCERLVLIHRREGRSGEVQDCNPPYPYARTGRARMDFHRHSVEISFSERSIGNPQSYGWRAVAFGGRPPAYSYDHVPKYPRYIPHRLGDSGAAAAGVMALGAQTAAAVPALASHTVKIDSMVTLPPPQKRPFYGRVKSNKHACEVHRLVKVYRVRPGRDHVADRGDAKDRTNQRGKWRDRQLILGEGDFYAKVVRRKEGTAGTTFVCRQDRSPIRHVEHQG